MPSDHSRTEGDHDHPRSPSDLSASVHIRKLKGRFIANKFTTGWVVVGKSEKKSVAGQFAIKYKSETYCWTQKLKKEDYGMTILDTSCCCKRVNTVENQ